MSKPDDIPEDVWARADELACKYIEWLTPTPTDSDAEYVLTQTIARAILAERERCAEVADEHAATARKIYDSDTDASIAQFTYAQSLAFSTVANAIRSRGQL